MSRERIDMDAILKRYLPRASQELVDEGSERVRVRIQEALQRREAEFGGAVDGRVIKLDRTELWLLTAVDALGDEAFGFQIFIKIKEIWLEELNFGSMNARLLMLENRGLLKKVSVSREAEGGRPATRFKLTPNGRFALSQAKLAAREATDAIGDLI